MIPHLILVYLLKLLPRGQFLGRAATVFLLCLCLGVDAQVCHNVGISSGLKAEVNPTNLNQVTFLVLDEPELGTLVSYAPKHLRQTFIK